MLMRPHGPGQPLVSGSLKELDGRSAEPRERKEASDGCTPIDNDFLVE